MESAIVKNLQPKFEPVAVVWSDTIPADAFEFKKGKFGCTLYLFAQASTRGKIAAASRDNIVCTGGRAALGLGNDFNESEEMLDHSSALFSKGIKSAKNKKSYQDLIDAAPKMWRSMYEYGERRHSNADLAKEWILHGLPNYDIPYKYVLFKPLSRANSDDNIKAVIFPVNPIELAGLITLLGSIMTGTDLVQVPQGADCNTITAFAYAQEEKHNPRAVMGMLGVDGREVMRKCFQDDIVTLTLPISLFKQMEQEADDCVFQIPSWKKLAKH